MLEANQIKVLRELIHAKAGISLGEDKAGMLTAKFEKFCRLKSSLNPEAALNLLQVDENVFNEFLNLITVNHTFFFREPEHFEYLKQLITANPQGKIKIWSCACSFGQEPYSIAMVCEEVGCDYKILASDVDQNALMHAQTGVYDRRSLSEIPEEYKKYVIVRGDNFEIKPEIRRKVTFTHINLVEIPDNIKPGFLAIFCRNVFIYFEKSLKIRCMRRFAELLSDHGTVFLGLSEFIPEKIPGLRFVGRSMYVKES